MWRGQCPNSLGSATQPSIQSNHWRAAEVTHATRARVSRKAVEREKRLIPAVTFSGCSTSSLLANAAEDNDALLHWDMTR